MTTQTDKGNEMTELTIEQQLMDVMAAHWRAA